MGASVVQRQRAQQAGDLEGHSPPTMDVHQCCGSMNCCQVWTMCTFQGQQVLVCVVCGVTRGQEDVNTKCDVYSVPFSCGVVKVQK